MGLLDILHLWEERRMGIKIKTRKNKDTSDEWRFTNQNWKGILNEISNYAPNRYGRGKHDYGEDHPLVKRLKIKPHELMLIMSFLKEQGLIEYDESEHNWINLTSKGFDVSIQNQRTAHRTNFYILVLTAIIAFSAVVSLVNTGLNWVAQVGLLAFLGILMFYLWKFNKKFRD